MEPYKGDLADECRDDSHELTTANRVWTSYVQATEVPSDGPDSVPAADRQHRWSRISFCVFVGVFAL